MLLTYSFLLLDPLFHSYSLFHFTFHSLNSSVTEFLFGLFLWSLSLCLIPHPHLRFFWLFFWFCWIVSMFSCTSLGFLKTAVLNSLLGKLQICVFWGLVTGRLLFLLWCHISLIFHGFWSSVLLSSHLK